MLWILVSADWHSMCRNDERMEESLRDEQYWVYDLIVP